MRKLYFSILCFTVSHVCFWGCGGTSQQTADGATIYDRLKRKNFSLTDEMVTQEICAYKKLRDKGAHLLEEVNKDQEGKKGFAEVEGVVKSCGFKDYPDFVLVNAKVAWAFSVAQGELGVSNFEQMNQDGLKQIDEQLKNPEVPEEVKKELRKSRQEIVDNWNKNKPWADVVLKQTKKLTSSSDIEVIKRHRKELEEAFSGVTLPKPPEKSE